MPMVYQETASQNWRLRPATEADFAELDRIRHAGLSSYAAFAPPGWSYPEPEPAELERVHELMRNPERWVTVAETDSGQIAGYVAAGPALSDWGTGDPVPGTAYLWMLFVDGRHHRSGCGRALHESALQEMRRRGYRRALVRMAAGADQARRFYAAAGWRELEQSPDEQLGLAVLVAERDL